MKDLRLSTRITLVGLLFVVAGGLLWISNENRRLHEVYLRERAADLETILHVEKVRLIQSVETLRQDVVFLSNTPPISGMVRASANHGFDPRDNDSYEIWEARMREIFTAFLRAHPHYSHVRYIGVANGGRELVRVNQRNGKIEVIQHAGLQAKGDRDFFKAGSRLAKGQVHLSEFNLEQEHGKITEPHQPTLRAVTPVFDAKGRLFGMVVLNIDTPPLFSAAVAALPPGVQGFVADRQGRYLFHIDARQAFTFELGGTGNITEEFPLLQPFFGAQPQNELPLRAVNTRARGYLAAERVYFDAGDGTRFLLMAYHIPQPVVDRQSYSISQSGLATALLVMMVFGIVFMLVLRRIFMPLNDITAVAGEIAAGNHRLRLDESGGGEFGKLARALNIMLDKLSNHELIERENAFRKDLIESLPGVFYMIDASGRFLLWNRNLELVSQRSPEEMAETHPLALFEGDDKLGAETAIRKVFEAGEASLEAALVAKDGSSTPYHFTGRRVLRDGVPVLIGLGLDITEQRESTRLTAALLRRNQALMQSSMEGIHVLDIVGNVVDVNEAFCGMLGYTREELMRLNVSDWDNQFTAAELRDRIKAFIGKSGIFDTVHRRKDGSLVDVEICATGIEIDGQELLFASGRDITERKKIQTALLRNKQVIDTALDGFWMVNAAGYLEEANGAYARMSGYTITELVGMHISHLEANERPEEVEAHIDKVISQGSDRFETRHRRKDGSLIDVEISTTYMAEEQKFFVFCHDITRRKQAEKELRVAATTFETHDAIVITDARSNILRVNRAFTEITGYSAEEVLGRNPRMMSSGRHDHDFYIKLWQQLLSFGSWSGEIWDKRKNGEVYPKWLTISAVKDEQQETVQYVAIFSDITERKRIEEEIHNLAFYDPLTQLPNRRLCVERMRAALSASARRRDYGAVLFLDMDNFKSLNDTLGHDFGDLMLIEVANRIKSCVREMDTVARLGGDEFVVLIEGVSLDQQDALRKVATVAEKIRESLARPYKLKEHEHHSSPSIGITLFRDNDESVDALLKHADLAMYKAKSGGRNAVRFFDPVMQDNAERHDAIEAELHHAVARDELRLYYQVRVDGEQRPIGAEALLRWQHPQRGLLLPEQFIHVAEESALIVGIGRWVLEEACARLARWRDNDSLRELTLTVNISARQFAQPDFVPQVAAAIGRHQLVPARLKLELTESVVAGDLTLAAEKIGALRELGVELSMDNFTTVYSSLSYLKQLSSDQLKIHRDVVRGVAAEGNDARLVRAIVELAKNMDLHLFAEGVETEAQFDFLKSHECKTYQGNLFGKPVPLAELEAMLSAPRQGDAEC